MRKFKKIYMILLVMMFSLTIIQASEPENLISENGLQNLTLEEAITKAQKRDKQLRMQQTNIELAKVASESAREYYYNSWDIGFETASSNYSQARAKEEYEIKNEGVIAEKVAYDIEKQFDEILELEENKQLAYEHLYIQEQKLNHAIKKEQLGLSSQANTKAEETKLESQSKELESLNQSIEAAYRKLNDAIGGKEEKYNLIKENTYEPLNMKRSLQGQISYSINADLGIWLQEEIAKAQEIAFIAPGPDGSAPTYTLYQQRKLGAQQDLNNIALSKEGKEKQVKQIYENILALEIQHDKLLIDLEEAKRQYEIMKSHHKLGMVTDLNLQEAGLGILQKEIQINSTVRQHNQLKILFDKTYLATS